MALKCRRFYTSLTRAAAEFTTSLRADSHTFGLTSEISMDLVFLVLGIAFFAATVALVHGFERLRKSPQVERS
jgi:hypothetical protein